MFACIVTGCGDNGAAAPKPPGNTTKKEATPSAIGVQNSDPRVSKFQKLVQLEKDGKPGEAVAGYRAFVEEFKDQPVPHYYLAAALAAKGDREGALMEIKAADAKTPGG
jgi:TolA-binding protein